MEYRAASATEQNMETKTATPTASKSSSIGLFHFLKTVRIVEIEVCNIAEEKKRRNTQHT